MGVANIEAGKQCGDGIAQQLQYNHKIQTCLSVILESGNRIQNQKKEYEMLKKIKNRDMVEFINFANGEFAKKKLPVRLSYAITRNLDLLDNAVKTFSKEREKILEDVGDIPEGEEGKEKRDQAAAKIGELLDVEFEAQIHTMSIDQIEIVDSDGKYDPLTPADVYRLSMLIEEKEEEEK